MTAARDSKQPSMVTIRYKTPHGVEGEWKVSVQVAGGTDDAALKACLKYWHPDYEYLGDGTSPTRMAL